MVHHTDRVEKAMLLSAYLKKSPRFQYIEKLLFDAMKLGGLELMMRVFFVVLMDEEFFKTPPIPIDIMQAKMLEINDTQSIQKLLNAIARFQDYTEEIQGNEIPTLVLQGENDFLCRPEMAKELADVLANCEFKVIPNTGHTLNIEAIEETGMALKAFLQK